MWPLDRAPETELLRVGAQSLERWVRSPSALSMVNSCALPVDVEFSAVNLAQTLKALYPSAPQAAVTVLFESVWLPVLLAEVGSAPWSNAQIEPLVRHRLQMIHGEQSASASACAVRVDYRAGERFALGFALPVELKQAFVEAGQATGLRWAALLPAFAWGLERLQPARSWPGRSGWWVWPEQDRMLVARIASRRIVALNTAAALTNDPSQIERLVEVEDARAGTAASSDPIRAATWAPPRYSAEQSARVRWMLVAPRARAGWGYAADPASTSPSP